MEKRRGCEDEIEDDRRAEEREGWEMEGWDLERERVRGLRWIKEERVEEEKEIRTVLVGELE